MNELAHHPDNEAVIATIQAQMDTHLPEVGKVEAAAAKSWAWLAFGDILVFFGVLMVGFAYLWRRGDIDWVRSTAAEQSAGVGPEALDGPTSVVITLFKGDTYTGRLIWDG